jgi:catechol 2,3-dioxygenase-like lactoylglutathione lyase family enzyme
LAAGLRGVAGEHPSQVRRSRYVTYRKDFKRVVRARARRTGESYSSALRNVRNARPDRPAAAVSVGADERRPLVNITRAVPDVRSTNIDKTVRFYTELLGFAPRSKGNRVTSFLSTSHAGVEVTLNRDGFALPPGFTVELASVDDVKELADRARSLDVRVIEPMDDERAQFSVLDPSGRRVTIAAAEVGLPPQPADASDRPIARAIPGSVIEATPAKQFYVDFLGFQVRREWPDIVMLESPSGSGAQVLAGMSLTSPDSFDLDVGTTDRVDAIHTAALGNAVVMGEPCDFPDQGIRCFPLVDPNGVAINVFAVTRR